MTDSEQESFADQAQRIIDANQYLTLSTADASGRPWVTPVFFTPDGDRFLWVSSPGSRHSCNIADRGDVAVVIFDSTVRVGGAEAAYFLAHARLVGVADQEGSLSVFNGRLPERSRITPDEIRDPGPLRLYEAVVTERSVLLRGGDPRNAAGIDTRVVLD